MQYAFCHIDQKVWEAYKFSLLPAAEIAEKRNSLTCVECKALAWFRKESTHGHPAHFCAHHEPTCVLKAEYVVVDADQGDGAEVVDQIKSSGDIVVRLDKERGGDIDVEPASRVPGGLPGEGGRIHLTRGQNRFSDQEFTLKRILHRLVQSPDFRQSTARLTFYRRENEPLIDGRVCDITRAFSEISRGDEETRKFYWGPITSAKRTPDGKIWLKSAPQYQAVSVVIFTDIAEDFLRSFNIDDLDDLAGAHVLVSGTLQFTGERGIKPIIWCGALYQIVIRRYRAANLQVAG
ncbi:hypothetical protein [Pseudomonas aeruginosa]|uniref:hypothetical protein n=1 Tax=Pseudomonas aeruginosa TaxID=287 RepID=UPI001068F0ED|nr:hypothetical protein [Pseudomonas aeruginosa]